MFSLLTLLIGCKDRSQSNWESCTDEVISYAGTEESEFGFRMLSTGLDVYITAPSNCTSPLYKLSDSEITPQSWSTETCDRWGQELVLQNGSPVLFGPLSNTRWQNSDGNLDINTPNIRRLQTLPDGRLVQLFTNTVKIGGIEHPLPATSMDLTNFDTHVAVLMRGTPTQIWTVEDTFTFENNTSFFSRIHPFALDLGGRKQWVLGGSSELVYTNGDTLFTVELPDWSILQPDVEHHPHISMGYASALIDLDDDGLLDWVVGAPTAGSGQDEGFPEQAGWVGWFEQRGREWILQQEWTGTKPFEHFGWSLALQQSESKRSVLVGAPGVSTVKQTVCVQQARR